MSNYVPTTGYTVARAEIRWPRGEGEPACSIVENLGDVVAVDPDGPGAIYLGNGKIGRTSGNWNVTVNPDHILAQAAVILPRDPESLDKAMPGIWSRLVRDMKKVGIHELKETPS